jgi:hypothetical protein
MTAQKMSDLVQLYLTRLVTTMPKTNSLYTRIRDEFVQVQAHIDNNTPMYTSITLLTQQLQSLESLALHNTNQPPQSEFRRPRMIPNHFKLPTNAIRPRKRKDQAYMITQSRKFRPIKCWGCGQGHNLRYFPTPSTLSKTAYRLSSCPDHATLTWTETRMITLEAP